MKETTDVSERLATAPVGKLMFKLAVPTVIAQFVNLLYNIVDRIYIGHMPEVGTTALTAVGLCFPIIYLVMAFTALIAQGGAPRAAIYMGRNDNKSAEKILGSCFTSLLVISAILTVVFSIFAEDLLWLFGASEATIGYSMEYLRVYIIGSVFVMLALGLNLFISTQGFTTISMLTVLIGAILNIVLDPIFIFALHMGVKGAAYATVISQAVSAIWTIVFLAGKKSKLKLTFKNMVPDMKLLLPCLALGLAPFIMQATEAVINVAFNSSLQKFGGDIAVGTMTVASTVMQMIWLPAQGIGMGAQPIISYNYGAGNADRCKQAIKSLLIASGVYLFTFWAVVELTPATFIKIFNNSPELIANANYLRIYIALMGLFFIQMTVQQGLISIGKAKASLFIACLRKLILLVPLIYILPIFFENKVFAVFLAEPVSDTISIIVSAIVFAVVFGKAMKELENKPDIENQ